MYITWYGQSTFKLQNKAVTILLDPYSARRAGLHGPNFKADIIILSNQEDKKIINKDLKEGCFLIDGPGEFEIKGIFVQGIAINEKQLIYRLLIDEISIGLLGELNSVLQADQLEKLDGLDVLLIPVGGRKKLLDSALAAKLVKAIEPRLVIPTCFQIPGLKESLDSVSKFAREFGIKAFQSIDKLRLEKKDIKSENGPELIILKPISH